MKVIYAAIIGLVLVGFTAGSAMADHGHNFRGEGRGHEIGNGRGHEMHHR